MIMEQLKASIEAEKQRPSREVRAKLAEEEEKGEKRRKMMRSRKEEDEKGGREKISEEEADAEPCPTTITGEIVLQQTIN